MSAHLSMALTFAAIAFAFFYPALFMRGGRQVLVADVERKPLPKYYGGTDDAAEWGRALRERVWQPSATVTQFPGAKS